MAVKNLSAKLKPNAIVHGPLFPEPVQVIVVTPFGAAVKIIGKGLRTSQVYEPILSPEQLATLEVTPEEEPFDGDASKFRLGIEAMRLALAYEYDPYFSLSIARVDPLPHQLEAVYDYFLKLPRIRFLLADDPGAGKTIMAGLLIKELKIRGLIRRILIVTPAHLSFQWQREMRDKFREHFEVIRSDVLRANYGSNPWQEKNQVVTSVSWVSRIEDAKDSLLRSHWDLIIVDEAHKMSAYSADKKTLAYQLGEALSVMTDHYLLMTATPHKGDPQNFCLFLELLDRDVYGDVRSLEEAMRRHEAPFYLRRVKEALVTFPDPDTGRVKTLFTTRQVQTSEFQIDDDEWDFYDALTRYVEDQSIKAAADDSARGRALGFTMAMLQRRFASSIYAVRRSLERMKDRREKILADPAGYRQEQILRRVPEDFDDLPEDEQQEILEQLENIVASVDPAALRAEILQLTRLIDQARGLEQREVESKLVKLRDVITEQGVFQDPKMKLLIFTEHKDTLDYLVGKLREWRLSVTQIHGGMKIGDRDTPNTRIYAEREFRETCQVLVATEAAGEGINLQFCWFMINYDIPWNPVRLEQRMGRIHRYGQEKDCLIFNFVSTNTREGRVLQKLFERLRSIEDDLDPRRTGKIFNVLGDIFPANQLERMLREMYAHNLTEEVIKSRIVEQVEYTLVTQELQRFLNEVSAQRAQEIDTITRHMEISLNELIHLQNLRMGELLESQQAGDTNPLLAANLKTTEDRLDELNGRLERRRHELEQERQCTIADIRHHGRAWVLPHPERTSPGLAPMVRDEEIEQIAVQAVITHEQARGWQVVSVEKENRGFDLISRKPHPEDPQTAIEVQFIEVKGRATVGEVALTTNEYKTAERLKQDYWLYVVFNCASAPEVYAIQDPVRLGWKPLVKIEHYHIGAKQILAAAQ
jgi:superfamily II DNA or RNA helicase